MNTVTMAPPRSPLFKAALAYLAPDADRVAIIAGLQALYPRHTLVALHTAILDCAVNFAHAGVVPK